MMFSKRLRNCPKGPFTQKNSQIEQERGVVLVTVALLMVLLLSIAALAVDIGSVMVVRNELQNAADAAALAGTRVLYLADGSAVNAGANAVAFVTAVQNTAQNSRVETVANIFNNTGDIERGHWKWSDHSFTPNASLALVRLHEVSDSVLDSDNNFINAVRVRVRRQATPAQSFLSSVMGFNSIPMQAEAVAYIGFAGSMVEAEADVPIAICQQSLRNSDGDYSCNTGRMINSGSGLTHNSAGWTNFTQEPCVTGSAVSISPYVDRNCNTQPSPPMALGVDMGTTGGEVQTAWDAFYNCWKSSADTNGDGIPDTFLNMTLPVIDCPNNNVLYCSELVGAVNVNMVWMIRTAFTNQYDWVPLEMTGPDASWSCPLSITGGLPKTELNEAQFLACFRSFVRAFNLVNYQEVSVTDLMDPQSSLNQTMFFLPDCTPHIPSGGTGGKNFSVLAKIPVLVR